jgi:hypothetical protein
VFGNSWRLGRIAGVEVRMDTSWVIIALLVTYSLYLQFTEAFEALQPEVAVVQAAVFALLFFGSVLAHEMGPRSHGPAARDPPSGASRSSCSGAPPTPRSSRGGPGRAVPPAGFAGRDLLGPPAVRRAPLPRRGQSHPTTEMGQRGLASWSARSRGPDPITIDPHLI